ncbi:hypothetical protein BX070DRAFT_67160 [Coemansia spiralis]|nr:hypothetical protein BX070DRAFT_67160 [Coemansia spiralis]
MKAGGGQTVCFLNRMCISQSQLAVFRSLRVHAGSTPILLHCGQIVPRFFILFGSNSLFCSPSAVFVLSLSLLFCLCLLRATHMLYYSCYLYIFLFVTFPFISLILPLSFCICRNSKISLTQTELYSNNTLQNSSWRVEQYGSVAFACLLACIYTQLLLLL